MGLFDGIKKFFEGREKGKMADRSLLDVKQAAQASNYNQASRLGFTALEQFGSIYLDIKREVSTTAREYSKLLVETGAITAEELEPIINNFELATYSEHEVTFDDYRTVEESLDSANRKLGDWARGKRPKKSKGGAKKRSGGKPKKRKGTAGSSAAKRRKARQRAK
ncbi:MAG: DUF4129 domain-containing protein [Candidatus Heimdallarchaeota archaeon]|nr:DUF4129 domain-containing protein [Candidatus Heimdallarchaeota archaeon]